MFTCPEKDIHSLYIDNELPQTYIADYEAHIASCEKCRRELEKLRVLRRAFEDDGKSMDFSKKDLDSSFERLQAKMSYSSNVKKKPVVFDFKPLIYIASGAAAALALVILPAKGGKGSVCESQTMAQSQAFQPVARTVLYAPSETVIPLDGELSLSKLSNLFADEDAVMDVDVGVTPSFTAFPAELSTVAYDARLGGVQPQNHSMADRTVSSLASYDVFTQVPPQNVPENSSGNGGSFSVEFSLGNFHFKAQGSGK